MRTEVRFPGSIYAAARRDLLRPHPFAAERVGFVAARLGTLDDARGILVTRYESIPDTDYIEDASVGAKIGPNAIVRATQTVYHGRTAREGTFHIHLHQHRGETGMSPTDARDVPLIVAGFQAVGPDAAHGIIILSLDHGSAWVSLPGSRHALPAARIIVMGTPIEVFERTRFK